MEIVFVIKFLIELKRYYIDVSVVGILQIRIYRSEIIFFSFEISQ